MFLELNPDVRDLILFYCDHSDLKKLSLCSQTMKQITQELQWSEVKIPFNQLNDNKFLDDQIITGFQDTKVLILGHEFGRAYPWMRSSDKFRVAFQLCNPKTIITGFLPRDAFDVFGTFDQLTDLYMTSYNATDYSLQIIYSKLNDLNLLSVKGSIITDKGLKGITKMKKLKSLIISECSKITDEGMMYIADVHSLEHLNVSSVPKLTYKGVQKIRKLELRGLDLSNCYKIDDSCIKLVTANLLQMEELNISMCLKVTDAGLKGIEKLENLNSIDVTGCCEINDMVLVHLPVGCKIKRL